jgi:hypothetical protein
MKIINEDKQLAYDLEPDTVLDMERTNPFFNEQGEQSLPVDIPATEKNRNILGFADQIGSNQRGATRFNATILDGSFVVTGRQAVLSAQRKGKISTSFYLNEGAMYSKIEEITLQQMFGDELIPGISTVAEAIAWCRTLIGGNNPNYCIFPALVDDGSNNNYPKYKKINRYGYEYPFYGGYYWADWIPDPSSGFTADFYNSIDRVEMDGDTKITIPPGYYITPFIKANYLLTRIFSYLGYTLNANFFTQTEPFTSMVFCNSCMDTLANGVIKVSDLVPECTISIILDIFRKKFCCEFIPNEVNKTIDIILFKDVVAEAPSVDLTGYLISQPSIDFPDYKQVILSSDKKVSNSVDVQEPDSLPSLITAYPMAYYDKVDCSFYRTGFYNTDGFTGMFNVRQRIAPSSSKFFAGSDLETEEITVPDCMAEFRIDTNSTKLSDTLYEYGAGFASLLFIGSPIYRNSKIVLSDGSGEDNSESKTQEAILAFFYLDSGIYPSGTISNYMTDLNEDGYTRLFDYTLCYYGPDGIYEKFYRQYDNILRNSKHLITAELILPETLRMSIAAHKLVSIQGQSMFINNLRYKIGGKPEPVESEFFTTKIHTPANLSPAFEDYFHEFSVMKWIGASSSVSVTEAAYNASPYKDRVLTVIYPPFPDPLIFDIGAHYYEQFTCILYSGSYYLYTYWLEVTPVS